MTEVMETGSVTVSGTAQTDPPGYCVECSVNLCAVQAIAPTGDEQIWRHRSAGPVSLASADVSGEHLAGRGVNRNQAIPTELCVPNGQYPSVEVDIFELEIARFKQA